MDVVDDDLDLRRRTNLQLEVPGVKLSASLNLSVTEYVGQTMVGVTAALGNAYRMRIKCGVKVDYTLFVVVMLAIELPVERCVFLHIIAGFTKNIISSILTIIGAIPITGKTGDFVVDRIANVPIRIGGSEINVFMPIQHIPLTILNVEFKCVTQGKLIG
ncbi:hypothetical protein CHS0354_024966 [Potamilus streckersoni]|uniref:Uncharacterized protein n=1 Tax=Potamilus streckersoni TaxID=2493646 RepID=A0AAE0T3E6_9BIVA|nr:hypothetical protein CHS0354_024966 [Potamilus streckersoni]